MSAEHDQDSSVKERTINSEELDGKSRTFSIEQIEQKIGRSVIEGDILYADTCHFPGCISGGIGPEVFPHFVSTYFVEVIGSKTYQEKYFKGLFDKERSKRSVREITTRRLTNWGTDDTNCHRWREDEPHLWTGIVKREDQPRFQKPE